MGEMIRIAAPVATAKVITKALAREVTIMGTTRGTTRVVTTKEARTREVDANATTARHSLTRMAGHMGPAEGWHLSFQEIWQKIGTQLKIL